VAVAVLIAAIAALALPAAADDPWNPFADSDRRTARPGPPPTTTTRADPRPYLAPMSPGDLPSEPPPARHDGPGLPPGYTPPVAGYPFDSGPGTYAPPPAGESWGTGAAAAPIVERGELTPMVGAPAPVPASIAPPATGGGQLPTDERPREFPPGEPSPTNLWAGLDANVAEELLAPSRLPPASSALGRLIARLLEQPVADPRLEMVRIAALLRTGAAAGQPPSANLASAASGNGPEAAVALVLETKADLAAGRLDSACAAVKQAIAPSHGLPAALKGEAIVIAGYCAVASGNREAGPLAATLARDAGYTRPFTLALLEATGSTSAPNVPFTGTATLIDGLLTSRLANPQPALFGQFIASAAPPLLAYLANLDTLPPAIRLAAAEGAAARNIITPYALAAVWRLAANDSASTTGATAASLERARQFAEAERSEAQFQKTRAIRALLDSAGRDGLTHVTAAALTPVTAALRPTQEISWFAETAVEILAAGGDYAAARQWIAFAHRLEPGAGDISHWLLLVDIADARLDPRHRGAGFRAVEDAAARGRFTPETLHRLATVLDALDYNVPIPLWNLASRSPQPQSGFLPETGLLTALKRAAEQRQSAATALFALQTIAPEGTGATHLLGLGEAIRALKRAGLEHDARRLGLEALFADWPRRTGG